jgi:inner membrane protein
MYRSGHWGLALLCYSPVVFGALAADITTLPLVIVGAVLTSGLCMLPDIDQWIPFTDHRGITHTVWFALLVGAVLGGGTFAVVQGASQSVLGQWIQGATLLGAPLAVTVGWFFGVTGTLVIVSHLIGDWLTKMGIRPYAPLSGHKHCLGITHADSRIGNGVLYIVGAVTILASFVIGTGVIQIA